MGCNKSFVRVCGFYVTILKETVGISLVRKIQLILSSCQESIKNNNIYVHSIEVEYIELRVKTKMEHKIPNHSFNNYYKERDFQNVRRKDVH